MFTVPTIDISPYLDPESSAAARDDAQRPAFEALATAAHPLFEALGDLIDTLEAEEETLMADPFS